MTRLALGDALRRRGRLCPRALCRPRLGGEISGELAQVGLGEVLGERRHDDARALAVSKIAKLLHEIALLLTPDDRNGLGVDGNALVPMTRRTKLRLGLDVIRGVRRCDAKGDADSENHASEACEHDVLPSPCAEYDR